MDQKKYFLGYMVRRVLHASSISKIDDRDSYANKRIDLPGYKLAELFAQNFSKMVIIIQHSIIILE